MDVRLLPPVTHDVAANARDSCHVDHQATEIRILKARSKFNAETQQA